MKKPGFWRVLVAYLIDWGMLPICFYILHTSYPFWMSGDGVGDSMTLLLGPFGLFALYFVICKFVFGKTLGKKIMGLQVVQTVPQATPQDTPQAAPKTAPIKQEKTK